METFVVRIFVPAAGERVRLTGVVEHVGTGRALAFRGRTGLVDAVLHELELGREPVGQQSESEEE